MAPRPKLPPTMNAAFRTEGKTTTQSALSSKSCGMLSGTSRTSVRTVPQFLNRSSSLLWSDALATSERSVRTTRMLERPDNNFRMSFSPSRFSCHKPQTMQPGCQSEARKRFRKWLKKGRLRKEREARFGALEAKPSSKLEDCQRADRVFFRRHKSVCPVQ